jgi:DNA-binding transcriptional MocR family regulator
VISLGTFSKLLSAPGLRLGWIEAHSATLATLAATGVVVSGGGANPFTSALLTSALDSGDVASYRQTVNEAMADRARLLAAAVNGPLLAGGHPAVVAAAESGYFMWVHLPSSVGDPAAFHEKCKVSDVTLSSKQRHTRIKTVFK